ncbi:MAG: aminoacetone oxidase family FAD-binding enzyme [Clostridia bacterium]|nr:aminoacetone oxidase family FAD-binding enzyme [Clostridia bacterium]
MMEVGIIGGGASGIMTAIIAARNGHHVTILEHNNRIGKKILATGNGRCNFTNMDMNTSFYHGEDVTFAGKILNQYNHLDTIRFFTELGLYSKNKNGGLYPYCEQASAVLDVLRMEAARLHIHLIVEVHVTDIKKEDRFCVSCQDAKHNMKKLFFDKVVIAAGSQASNVQGSDGSGYELLKKLGLTVRKPLPALVQLQSDETYFKSVSGIRCDARLKLLVDQQVIHNERGELQLTAYGISGIPVFQLSSEAARALDEKKEVRVVIDFMPDLESVDDMKLFLENRIRQNPEKICEELFLGLFHKNIGQLLLKLCGIRGNVKSISLTPEQCTDLSKRIKQFDVPISATNPFDQAQTCSGGLKTSELSETLEVKKIKGLYVTGELIDIDGACGGYNLQWAWSSGMVAGNQI